LDTDQTRRMFLGQAGASLGLLWLSALTPDLLAQAHAHAQEAGKSGAKTYRFFTPQQAAEFDAFSAQIIPTDDTPGAREANVVHFTDYVLSTIDSGQQAQVKDALKALHDHGIESLFVEGGPTLLRSFFDQGFIDVVTIFVRASTVPAARHAARQSLGPIPVTFSVRPFGEGFLLESGAHAGAIEAN